MAHNLTLLGIFTTGFFVSFTYCLLGLAMYVLVRGIPEQPALAFALFVTLLVCAAGGAIDVRRNRRVQWLQKPRFRDLIWGCLVLLLLLGER